jgi:hypothetical protein
MGQTNFACLQSNVLPLISSGRILSPASSLSFRYFGYLKIGPAKPDYDKWNSDLDPSSL